MKFLAPSKIKSQARHFATKLVVLAVVFPLVMGGVLPSIQQQPDGSLSFSTGVDTVEAAVSNVRPRSNTTDGADTTSILSAYDGDTSSQSVTTYGGNQNPELTLFNWAATAGTVNSYTLEVKYEATVPSGNDTYKIKYSVNQTVGACSVAAGTWTDLVPFTAAAASDGTIASTSLSSSQNLGQVCVAVESDQVQGGDTGTLYLEDVRIVRNADSTILSAATSTDPLPFSIAPGSTATVTNSFAIVADVSDTITNLTVSHSNASSTSLIEIVSSDGATVYGSVSNPTGTSSVITLSTNTLTATTATTTYKIRVTPKTHANLPSGNKGALIPVTTTVLNWSGTNTKVGTDTAFPVIIDNQSLPTFGINGSSSLAAKVDYTTGTNPVSVSTSDLNNDGYADLVVTNQNAASVSVFLNNGNGTYATKVDYTTGSNPGSVTTADFNNDGYVDLVLVNSSSASVSVFLNNGDGTFATKVDYTTGASPDSLTAADINNDGYLDLAVANNGANSVSALLNNGNGTFATKVDFTTGTGPGSITAADFNNDGYADLAVVHFSTDSLSVHLNNGDGTYASKVDYTTRNQPVSITAADFNNDGYADLVVANDGSASVFLNNGDGTYATKVDYTTGADPRSVTTADLNNDGYADLAVVNNGSASVSVFTNIGDGTFAAKVDYTTGANPRSVTSADFNNDGYADLAVANNGSTSVSVFLNNATSSLTATTGPGSATLSYITPPHADLNSVLFLASTSPVTTVPVDGTTYTGGETVGGATVACVDTSVATSTADSCVASGLSSGTPYYFAAFTKDTSGNYSYAVTPVGSPVTPDTYSEFTTISAATTTDPFSFTIAPGSTATVTNSFALKATANDVVTSLTVAHQNASSTSLIEIVSSDGTTVYGSVSNPTGTSSVITLSTNTLTATTATTTYKIRITPKSHANLPVGNKGALIPFIARVLTGVGTTNGVLGTDTALPMSIDNQSLPSFGISGSSSVAAKVDYTTASSPRSITAADLNNDGYADLAVANQNSNSVSVFLNDGNGTYATKVDYTTGSVPIFITSADLNNDGYADLAVANNGSSTVSIFFNNGNGTYAAKVDYTTGTGSYSVTAADLNNDGYADLAVANYNSNSVSVFLNNGNGTYAAKVDYTTGSFPNSVSTSDLNNDGYADLAVVNQNSNSVSVFLNNGNGTYASKVDYTTGSLPTSVSTSDLNNDGYPDLAVANYGAAGTVSVLLNNGNGTYAAKVDYTTGANPRFVSTSDFNNDGYADLAVANQNSNSVSIFLNNGNGTYAAKVDYTTGSTPVSVSTSDLNNDGYADLAVASQNSNSVSVFLNNATSSLTATTGPGSATLSYITPPHADLNSVLFLASTSPVTTVPVDGTTYTGGETVGGATVACVDTSVATSTADSCVASGLSSGTPYYFAAFTKDTSGNYSYAVEPIGSPVTPEEPPVTTLNSATTTDPATVIIAPGSTATVTNSFAIVADVSDTITNLTVSHNNASSTSLIEIVSSDGTTVYGSVANPTGTSSVITLSTNTLTATTATTTYKIRITPKSHANLPVGNKGALIPITTTVLDWSGSNTKVGTDTAFPVIIDNQSLPSFGISGSSSVAAKVDYTTGTGSYSVSTSDLNNDGYADLAVANFGANTVSVLLNNGNGTYAAKVDYTTGTGPISVSTADLNNDGYADLAVANQNSNSVSVFLNNGNGTYATKVDYTTGSNPVSVAAADLNNDGYVDLAVVNSSSASVSVFLNNGDGTYASKVDYTTGTSPVSVTTVDLNNDGYADLAVANYDSNSVSVFLNNGNGTYASKVDYTTGTLPSSVTAADLNNDGYPDLAVANYVADTVSVLLNNGNGTYASKVDYTTGTLPSSVTAADLNNDGYADLAVANQNSNSVSVFLNNGNGTYASKVDYTTGSGPLSVTAADLNNDGYADLAVANNSSSSVSVFLNNATSSLTVSTGPGSATLSYITPPHADLNSVLFLASTSPVTTVPVDGTTYTGGETVGGATVACVDTSVATSTADSCVASGLSSGTTYYFAAFTKDTSGNYSYAVEPIGSPVTPEEPPVTTLNSATTTDPATVIIAPGSMATITNSFTFTTESGTEVISAMTVAHQNASSTSLIEIVSSDGATVYGSVSNPTGTSSVITLSTNTLTATTATTTYKIRITPKSQANLPGGNKGALIPITTTVLDWSGSNTKVGTDTAFPVIIDNQSLPTFGISGSSSVAAKVDYTTASSPRSITAADLNKDGYADLAVANWNSNSVSVFLNNGNGTYASKVDYTTGSGPIFITSADLNNDGYPDLAVANFGANTVSVLLNNGNGTYAAKVDYTTGSGPIFITSADLNNDGYVDLAVANYSSNSVSVLLNNGNGTYASKVDYATATNPQSVTAADLNNDGYADLAVANNGSATVSIFLNNGNGTYAAKVDYTTGTDPYSVTTADLNNDGYVDLAVANYSSNSVSVFLNNGNGTYAAKVDYTTGTNPVSVSTSDLNNDGYADLAAANYNSNSLSVFLNNGNGTYAAKVDYTTGANPRSVTAADLNNDGFADLAVANQNSNSVSVFLNNATSSLTVSTGPGSATLSYITPPHADLNSVLFLASTSPVTTVPVDGTTYTGGETIGGATVACVDTSVATSTADSCVATGLTGGTTYYFAAFTKDTSGNYSYAVEPIGSPVTLSDVLSITLAGTLYENDGVTPIATGKTIVAAVGTSTSSLHSATSDGSGNFSITGIATSTSGGWATTTHIISGYSHLTYGNGMFVAVQTSDPVQYSYDGLNWATTTAAGNNDSWRSIVYGNGLFVAVGDSGDRVMTSPDGITWTARSAAGNDDGWFDITYGNGLFVAVGNTGDRVMTSPDGINWTARSAAGDNDSWGDVTYGNGLFVAVGFLGTDRVMTSPDGITWTARSALGDNEGWSDIAYGNGLYVAVGYFTQGIMTSPDGIIWTESISVVTDDWESIEYANGRFFVHGGGDMGRLIYSEDTISWTQDPFFVDYTYYPQELVYADGYLWGIGDGAVYYGDAGFGENTPITLFVDGDAVDATTLTYGLNADSGTTTIYVDLYADTFLLKKLTIGSSSNEIWLSDADVYDASDDADILFTATTSTTSVTADVIIDTATVVLAPQTLVLDGDFSQQGTFYAERGEVVAASRAFDVGQPIFVASTSLSEDIINSTDIYMSPSGQNFYVMDVQVNSLKQYTLATPYEISSISFLQSSSTRDGGIWQSVFFKPDGTKFYTDYSDGTSHFIDQYDLSTPWDISTLSFSNSFPFASSSDPTFKLQGITFSSNGEYLYANDGQYEDIVRYPLLIPWDLSTLQTGDVTFDIPQDWLPTAPRSTTISSDGVKLIIGDQASSSVQVFTMSTPYDISTASTTYTLGVDYFVIENSSGAPFLTFSPGGDRMYVSERFAESLYQYTLDTPQTFTGTLTATSSFYSLTNQSELEFTLGAAAATTNTFTIASSSNTTTFNAGSSYTFQNIDWQGTDVSTTLQLRSSASGTAWYLDVPGSQLNVQYVDVQDSDASVGAEIVPTSSIDSGNNVNWLFPSLTAGSSTIANHSSGQVDDAFSFQNKTNEPLFAFALTPNSGTATVTELVLALTGVGDVLASDFSSVRLYRDTDNDGNYDATDELLGTGSITIAAQLGSITFGTDFIATTTSNYLVVADWNAPARGSAMKISLLPTNLTSIDAEGAQLIFGVVDTVQHNRLENRGGGGGVAAAIGDLAPVGNGIVTGGTNLGGQLIGTDPDFKLPTANAGSWTAAANAYDNTDGTYASTNANTTQNYQDHNFTVPGSNQVAGISVRLEVSGTTAAGNIGVELSWDGGTTYTTAGKTTGTLTSTDAVVTLGGASDLWGRTWSANDFSNANFRVRLTGNPSTNTVQLDALQVRVYHQASGGGGGGGGAI